MTMAVAEKTLPETKTQAPRRELNLGLASVVGGVIVLAGLGLVFGALPVFWSDILPTAAMNPFLSGALLLLVSIAAFAGVCYALYSLDKSLGMPGLRAGSVIEAIVLFVLADIVFWIGNTMSQEGPGWIVVVGLAAALAAGLVFLSTRRFFADFLLGLEDGGWFTSAAFKGNQGVRVRRATVLGILALGVSGIITLVMHSSFGSTRTGGSDWYWYVPFTGQPPQLYVPLLFHVNVLGPLLMGAVLFWFAWRVVNWPTFADFLIATEAEMNKVSWTTWPRLRQDTIVVLVTTFLLTVFLFGIDLLWFKLLSSPWVNVLQVNLRAEQQKQQEKTQW
jgi:preprotein translocase SecE subunit